LYACLTARGDALSRTDEPCADAGGPGTRTRTPPWARYALRRPQPGANTAVPAA